MAKFKVGDYAVRLNKSGCNNPATKSGAVDLIIGICRNDTEILLSKHKAISGQFFNIDNFRLALPEEIPDYINNNYQIY